MSKKLTLGTLCLALLALTAFPVAAATPEGPASSLDDAFAKMAARFPGFGGLYYDEQGIPHVFLRDRSQAPALRQLGPVIDIEEGLFDYRELRQWRLRLRPEVLALDAVVTLDVDEAANRVRIGVDRNATPAALAELERAIAFALVPSEAVLLEKTDPIVPMATLRDQARPVPGGVQINFGNFLCTEGFNAVRAGVAGFVTNSHCTDRQGGVESTRYYQPLSPAAIATEIADPDYGRNLPGCPKGKKCRVSDSSFARYDSSSLGESGRIARTTSRGQFNGSITIDNANPRFTVAATGAGSVGLEVNKVGRTTGWTFGPISQTCVDVSVSGSNIAQLCQDIVDSGVGGGDSGSPVFTWSGGGNVTLVGILWGGNSAGTLFVYSPFANIQSDLGTLNVF